jgi:hypothetical protein
VGRLHLVVAKSMAVCLTVKTEGGEKGE